MSDNTIRIPVEVLEDTDGIAVELEITDPTTGQVHTFTGATEAQATAAAERFFGVDEAERIAR
jgi:hypothetical protein